MGGKLAENESENALATHRNYHYIPEIHRHISVIRFASKSQLGTLAGLLRELLPRRSQPEIDDDAVEDNLSI